LSLYPKFLRNVDIGNLGHYTFTLMVDDSSTSNLHRLAIDAALKCQWSEALEINKQIIKLEPENVDCLNRLAKAYMELGKYALAKKTYEDALKLDPYNTIAEKNIKKVASFKKNGTNGHANGLDSSQSMGLHPDFFLEEPGTTRMVNLIKCAEPAKLLTLSPGQVVNLVTKNKAVYITDGHNQYLGVLPDDTGFHLRKLISGGNKYMSLIKSIKSNGLTILIKEIYRSKKFKNQASFLDQAKVLNYSSDNIALLTKEMEDAPDEEVEDDAAI
jgi:tetratricopeptide (TPR) repeat protein